MPRITWLLALSVCAALAQVQWTESRFEDFRDGVAIDPAMYVSHRANLDSDSGCVEFYARFDVNNDGRFDLGCSDYGGPYLRLYMGASPATCSLYPISAGGNIDLADLNLDGYAELIHSGFSMNNCYIYWGSPSGPRNAGPTTLPTGGGDESVCAYDLDKDGYLDVVCGGYGGIIVYWGSQSGYQSGNRTIVNVPDVAHNTDIADLDRDGWGDIVVPVGVNDYYLIVYWGPNRAPREVRRVPFRSSVSPFPHGSSVCDFDRDGFLDLVCTGYGTDTALIYFGSQNGIDSLRRAVICPGKSYGGSACVDINGDGWLDVLFFRGTAGGATRKPVVYFNTRVWPFFTDASSQEIGPLSLDMTGGFVADINSDGTKDIFTNCFGSSSYVLWGPTFSSYTAFPVSRDHHGVFREVGNVYDRSYRGEYTSNIEDVGQLVTSGFVSWVANTPGGSQVKVKVRGGNVVGQDTTWTDWFYSLSGAALPQQVLNQTLYQYSAEFLYTTPCFLPWLERIEFDFNGMTPQTRVIRVTNAGNPVPGCKVYVNGVPQLRMTDSRGELRAEGLRVGDQVWAEKKVYTEPAAKNGHEAVDGAMFDLWMDTKSLMKVGNYWDWYPDLVSGTVGPVGLDLSHPIFKWNLVVSTEWNIPDDQWDRVEQNIKAVSNWLYGATDGQMMLGKVAVYDAKAKWLLDTDARVSAQTWLWANSGIALYDRSGRQWVGGGIRTRLTDFGRMLISSNNLEKLASHYSYGYGDRVVAHEFCHYALGLLDEYCDGWGGHNPWPYREEHGPGSAQQEFPEVYGLMDNHTEDAAADISSWCHYLPAYSAWPWDPDKKTMQYYWWQKPCWETLKEEFENTYGGIVVRFQSVHPTVEVPESTSIRDPTWDTRIRRGPMTNVGCLVDRHNTAGDCFDAQIRVRNPSHPGYLDAASVGVEGKYDLGYTSWAADDWVGLGVLGVGLEVGDHIVAKYVGEQGLIYFKRVEVLGRVNLIEIEFTAHDVYSAPPNPTGPRLVTDVWVSGDSVFSINASVYSDESLSATPRVVVFPDEMDSVVVMMSWIGHNWYTGSSHSPCGKSGSVRLIAVDTSGNATDVEGHYLVTAKASALHSEFYGSDGRTCLVAPSEGLSVDNVSVYTIRVPTESPIADGVLVGDLLSVKGAGGVTALGDSATLSVDYRAPMPASISEDSLRIFRWNDANRNWLDLGVTRMAQDHHLSVRIGELGVYALFAPRSSDSTPPDRIRDLGVTARGVRRDVELVWIAPGDDSNSGRATAYDLRYGRDSISPAVWDSCVRVRWMQSPRAVGLSESIVVSVPEPGVRYFFAIRASDEAGNWSPLSNVVSVIAAPPPPIPTGSTPPNHSYTNDRTPTFWWGEVLTDSGFYRFQYARDPEFTQGLVTADSLDTLAFTVPDTQALAEGVWYWRVAAYDKYGNTHTYQEPPYQFTVDTTPPEPPHLTWPADEQTVGSRRPRLIWTAAGGDWGKYRLEIARDSLFAETIATYSNIYDTVFRLSTRLPAAEIAFYWHVLATDGAGNVGRYQNRPSRFYVDTLMPAAPYPILPLDGDMLYDSLPRFVWTSSASNALRTRLGERSVALQSDVAGAIRKGRLTGSVKYRLQIALNDSFTPCLVDTGGIGDTSATLSQHLALPDSTYFWWVEAVDSSGRHSGFHPPMWFIVDARGDVSGELRYYSNQHPVPGVRVAAEGVVAETVAANSGGQYHLTELPWFLDYGVRPFRRDSVRQAAVSAFDAAMVLRHVVRRDTLDSLQFIAGDVSGDGTISAFDVAKILQYAVGRIRHFPVGYRPALDTVDWAFRPPTRTYDSLTSNQVNQNYRGILYGDPSGNWPGVGMLMASGGDADGGGGVFYSLNMPDETVVRDRMTIGARREPKEVKGPKAEGKALGTERNPIINDALPGQRSVGNIALQDLVFPVQVKAAKDAVSADMLVHYDPRQLKMTRIRTTEATEGFMVAAVDRNGYVRIGIAGTRRLNGDIALLQLIFEPVGSPPKDAKTVMSLSATEPSTVNGQQSSINAEQVAASGARSAVGVAEIVWLVLNENVPSAVKPVLQNAEGKEGELPRVFYLAPPKPNPFGSGTCIEYGLPWATKVNLAIYDVSGSAIRTLTSAPQAAGRYSLTWNGRDNQDRLLSNGIYFIRLETESFRSQRKVTLLRR